MTVKEEYQLLVKEFILKSHVNRKHLLHALPHFLYLLAQLKSLVYLYLLLFEASLKVRLSDYWRSCLLTRKEEEKRVLLLFTLNSVQSRRRCVGLALLC